MRTITDPTSITVSLCVLHSFTPTLDPCPLSAPIGHHFRFQCITGCPSVLDSIFVLASELNPGIELLISVHKTHKRHIKEVSTIACGLNLNVIPTLENTQFKIEM